MKTKTKNGPVLPAQSGTKSPGTPSSHAFRVPTRRDLLTGNSSGGPRPRGATLAGGAQRSRTTRDTLITIFLRGAADGLSICAPVWDGDYKSIRGVNAIPEPDGVNGVVGLDGTWALSAGASALEGADLANHLAIVHATGAVRCLVPLPDTAC